jgi:hypothetical protein
MWAKLMLRISLVKELCRQHHHCCQYLQAASFVHDVLIIFRSPVKLAYALLDAIIQFYEQNEQTHSPASLLGSIVHLMNTQRGRAL